MRWLPNGNEINTNEKYMVDASPNARSPNATYIPLTPVGGLAFGVTQILAFLDTNMLVSQTQIFALGAEPMRSPNASSFVSQWNIGLNVYSLSYSHLKVQMSPGLQNVSK